MGSNVKGSSAVTMALHVAASGTSAEPPDRRMTGGGQPPNDRADPANTTFGPGVSFQRLKDGTYGPALQPVALSVPTGPTAGDRAHAFAQEAAALLVLRLEEQGVSARNELKLTSADVQQLRRSLREAGIG